jgi:transposase
VSAKVEILIGHLKRKGASTMKITTIGLDIAKLVFSAHGADEHGRTVVRKKLRRSQVMEYFSALQPCTVAMEACAGAHQWARQLQSVGHTVRLIAPQYVKPYVKTNKNDAADAEAICEAARQANMRFVSIKSVEQQEILCLHRARQQFVKSCTAQANQIRGLLAEFGLVVPQGLNKLHSEVPRLLEQPSLPTRVSQLLHGLMEHLRHLERQRGELERQITLWHRQSPASRRLEAIPGIGVLTATALVGTLAQAQGFANGRQLAACLGVVPRQHSTGGKQRLLGISKRGDGYLRTLLIHGGRALVSAVKRKPQDNAQSRWLRQLIERRGANVAAVAVANKNARIAWALLTHAKDYEPQHAAD